MKIVIDLPDIKGYDYTGEFRIPLHGEYIPDNKFRDVILVTSGYQDRFHIMKKVKWRAKDNEYYYTILQCDGELIIQRILELDEIQDYHRFRDGNYFETEEIAEEKLEKVISLLKKL